MDWERAAVWMAWGGTATAAMMIAFWLVQMRTRNAAIVDFGWSLALASFAVFYAVVNEGWLFRRILVGAGGAFWGYRLAWHLRDRIGFVREEGRYATLRRRWDAPFDLGFLVFFLAQAVLAVYLSLPFLLATGDGNPGWTVFDALGILLVAAGVTGESIADAQLRRWKRDPANRGRTCRSGLWRYSRHPNYFFEWVIWLGFAAWALQAPNGWLGLLAPATMVLLITRVTGIPPTEAQAIRSRGDDYRRYQETTSAFLPLPPRQGGNPS